MILSNNKYLALIAYYCTFSFWLLALMILAANIRVDEFSMHLWTCPKRPLKHREGSNT